ncbi:LysM peptidoglycan-binding domain-containing protein [Nocardiopsis ansamitocini]|uniref:LysM domain-containing protein n=1 Tax=Nocardiopsis ansamitocini TaxID=1670832 RepID=A0A9W6P6H2_9ACTN|nr:LysM peptidoglycan-binding domain-containing protein [Nocardiopsis ansamitocini]GLU48026.1 hypothetical protein Nans01_23770 [Nocardiopsis ansamitocini]
MLVSAAGSVAATAFAFTVLAAVALGASSAGASTESLFGLAESSTVVVGEGDTLWDIAQRVRPFEDPRRTVQDIVDLNGLSGSALEPGQELVLPSVS